jgi:hypothetical protein
MKIVLYQKGLALSSLKRPVPACLVEAGHHVFNASDEASDNWGNADLIWMQGNANWYPRACRRLERARNNRPRVLIWHSEPLPARPGSGLKNSPLHLREIIKILLRDKDATDPYSNSARIMRLHRFGLPDLLVVSSRSRQEYLGTHGIESYFVPFGYHEAVHGRMPGCSRDIEVLFLGSMQVPRRRRLIRELRLEGVDVKTVGGWHSAESWGDNRTRLLNRTKVLLNLGRHPGEFSGLRMLLGMSSGALVISEPIDLPEPFIVGRHYIETPIERMPEVIHYYLEHPKEREQIIDEAYRFVVEELTMRSSVKQVLEKINSL